MTLRRAFTLIELLVVIAIIAILAAILFPVFAEAKVSAKITQCMMHMRQVGYGLRMYADENDSLWAPAVQYDPLQGFAPQRPWIGYDNNNSGYSNGFTGSMLLPAKHPIRPGAIDPYLKSDGVKRCVAAPTAWQLNIAYNWWSNAYYSDYYARNPKASGNEYGPGVKKVLQTSGYWDTRSATDSDFEEPSTTIVAWEHANASPVCNFLQPYDWFNTAPTYDAGLKAHFNFLHRDGSNTIWGDMHSKHTLFNALKRPWFSLNKSIYQ